ncbi:MAG: polysaccharide biosynthesis C-terminal domain-containing protein [Bacteroidota bacterium]
MRSLKELFSDTLIYGISSVFARFINYLLIPLYTGVFDTDQYGVVSLVYAALAFLNVLLTMGMESAYLRYGKDRDTAKSTFKTLQLFLLGASAVLLGLLYASESWVVGPLRISDGSPVFLMMLGILFFDTLSIVPFAELRLVRKAWSFALLRTTNVLINLALNFYLILSLDFGIEAIFISNLAASGITAILIWAITFNMLAGAWNGAVLKQALAFGLPFIPAGIGYAINEMLDRFFLNELDPFILENLYGIPLTPDDVVGIYSACYKLAVFMLLFVQMFRMAWQPFFMRKSEGNDAAILFADTFRYFNVGAAAIYLLVSLFVAEIAAIRIPGLGYTIVDSDYWMGLPIVPFLLAAYWFQGWYVNFSAGIFISEKTKRLAQITLSGALITIVANLGLIHFYGMLGSAIATVLSYAAMALLIHNYSTKAFAVPYPLYRGFIIICICGVTVWAQSFLSEFNFSHLWGSLGLFVSAMVIVIGISLPGIAKTQMDEKPAS